MVSTDAEGLFRDACSSSESRSSNALGKHRHHLDDEIALCYIKSSTYRLGPERTWLMNDSMVLTNIPLLPECWFTEMMLVQSEVMILSHRTLVPQILRISLQSIMYRKNLSWIGCSILKCLLKVLTNLFFFFKILTPAEALFIQRKSNYVSSSKLEGALCSWFQ